MQLVIEATCHVVGAESATSIIPASTMGQVSGQGLTSCRDMLY